MLHQLSSLWQRFAMDQPCIGCQQSRVNNAVCDACYKALAPAVHACEQCARPLQEADSTCTHCLLDPPDFDRCTAAFQYTYPLMEWLHACKYQKRIDLAHVLAECLGQALPEAPRSVDALIAMPLDRYKRSLRGFNIADILAQHLARQWNIPLIAHAVSRPEHRVAQASLDLEARRRNIRGAFRIESSVHGIAVGVVDDVLTTGATLSELSRSLKTQGASWVETWVLARA